jgi:hypothetical protein
MALPTKLTLEIVTPDRALVREEVDEVQVPGSEGYGPATYVVPANPCNAVGPGSRTGVPAEGASAPGA